MVVDAERGRGVALRVEVDHQDPQPVHGQRGGEVDGGGGLAHPALLVGHHHHPGGGRPGQSFARSADGLDRSLGGTRDGRVIDLVDGLRVLHGAQCFT